MNSYPQDSTEITTPWEVIGNPYSQRNEHIRMGKNKFDYYGSGDVNNDGEINNSDLGSIVGSGSYRADVNLDGVSGTSQDRETLEDDLLRGVPLPAHINELDSFGKENYFYNMMENLLDLTPYLEIPGWVCRHRINQATFIGGGLLNPEEFNGEVEYDFQENGLLNAPVYYVSTLNTNGEPHGCLGFPIADGSSPSNVPTNFEKWKFMSYLGEEVTPGDFHMHEDGYAYVSLAAYVDGSPFPNLHTQVSNIVKWDLENGEATLMDDYRKDLLITSNPNRMEPRLNSLGDIYVQGEEGQSLDPFVLEQLGYNAVPDTFLTNVPSREEGSEWTKPKVEFTYRDRDTIPLSTTNPDKYFKFTRDWFLSSYLGGVIKRDSTEHKVTVEFTTDIAEDNTPTKFELKQNYPNPFNPTTTIEYSLPRDSFVEVKIYNILGKEIHSLVNQFQRTGLYQLEFDGSHLPSGIYYYRLKSGHYTKTMKMLLLK